MPNLVRKIVLTKTVFDVGVTREYTTSERHFKKNSSHTCTYLPNSLLNFRDQETDFFTSSKMRPLPITELLVRLHRSIVTFI